jgi:hypothetical protein
LATLTIEFILPNGSTINWTGSADQTIQSIKATIADIALYDNFPSKKRKKRKKNQKQPNHFIFEINLISDLLSSFVEVKNK